MKRQRFRPRKTAELIIFILSRFKDGLTQEQLSFLLWQCDMDSFAKTGQSITGARWIKTETGVTF